MSDLFGNHIVGFATKRFNYDTVELGHAGAGTVLSMPGVSFTCRTYAV